MTKQDKEREVENKIYIEEEETFATGKVKRTIVSYIYDTDFIKTKYKTKKGEELAKIKTLSKKDREDLNAEGGWKQKATLSIIAMGE